MSHRPTCIWDGSHRREDSKLELEFFRPLLELLRVQRGNDALDRALQTLGLRESEFSYTELWLGRDEAERLLQALAADLGGEAGLRALFAGTLVPDLAGFNSAPPGASKQAAVEAVLARAQALLPGTRFSLGALRIGGFDLKVELAGAESSLLAGYRRALFAAALRQSGAWACRLRPLPGPDPRLLLERVLAPGLGCFLRRLPSAARRQARLRQDQDQAQRRWLLRSMLRIQGLVMDGSQDGVAVKDGAGRWVYANQRMLELLKLSVSGADAEALAQILDPYLVVSQGSEWVPVAGGHLQVMVAGLAAPDGTVPERVLRLRRLDAEELQRADAAARAELLAALIDHGQEALLILDSDGLIRYGTPNLARLFGHDRLRLVGQGLEAIFEAADADEARSQISQLVPGAGISVRLRLRHGGGGRRWVQVGIDDRRQTPEIRGILLQLRDVTQMMEFEAAVMESEESLRRSESFYRMIIEGSSDLIVLLDSQRRVIFANKAVAQTLGRSLDEVKGKDILDFIIAADHGLAHRALAEAEQKSWAVLRLRVQHADGSRLLLEAHGRYTVNPDGRTIFVVAAHDVTRMDALERHAAQEGRLEAVGRLAGGVAHDFNNLLTVIQGNAELALGDEAAAVPGRIREIMDAAVRASELVQQLLMLGRKQVLRVQALDLGDLLREHEGFIHRIMGSSIRLRIGLGQGLAEKKLVVRAETLSLTRALLNLAANAKDAMPEGGAFEIICSRHRVDGAENAEYWDRSVGDYVRIDLRDTGSGMGPEVLARIYEPYFTTRSNGNGLGLPMVLGMVRQMGGFMTVESQLGEGSCFSLFLPEGDQAESPAPVAPLPEALPQENAQRCILVVDDENGVRRLAADGLRRQGYQVLEASDGEEALALWREARHHHHPIDLVLSDVVMPHMDGIQLCDMLQAIDPQQRCLLMSGYYDAEKMGRKDRSVGLPKPFTVQNLCVAVENALKVALK